MLRHFYNDVMAISAQIQSKCTDEIKCNWCHCKLILTLSIQKFASFKLEIFSKKSFVAFVSISLKLECSLVLSTPHAFAIEIV